MKKVLLSGMLITGLVMASPAIVQACPKGGAGAGAGCAKCAAKASKCKVSKLKKKVMMLWMHKDALEISEEQMDKIKDIKHAAMKKLIQLNADKDIVMVDLKSEMWEESMNLGAVNKLVDTKYAAKTKTAKTYVKAISDIQKVLTEAQRAKWREIAIASKMGKCAKCVASGGKCAKCAGSSGGGKVCPLTGKPLGSKGSDKGSMK